MRKICIALVSLTLLIGGCKSTHSADVKGKDAPYQEKGRIQWNSSSMSSMLRVEKAVADRTPAGLMRVRMVLRNKTGNDLWVDVRTVFTDDQGFEKEQTNWEPICCNARTQTTYETVSLGAQVSDFQVIIRDPKETSWRP